MKKCAILFTIRKMPIKTTMRYHYSCTLPFLLAKLKIVIMLNAVKDAETLGSYISNTVVIATLRNSLPISLKTK
jgi:hypothetical protein